MRTSSPDRMGTGLLVVALSRGLIGLGRIDSGVEALNVPGSLKVTIEQVGK